MVEELKEVETGSPGHTPQERNFETCSGYIRKMFALEKRRRRWGEVGLPVPWLGLVNKARVSRSNHPTNATRFGTYRLHDHYRGCHHTPLPVASHIFSAKAQEEYEPLPFRDIICQRSACTSYIHLCMYFKCLVQNIKNGYLC